MRGAVGSGARLGDRVLQLRAQLHHEVRRLHLGLFVRPENLVFSDRVYV